MRSRLRGMGITVNLPNDIPERVDDQDEAIIVLVMRRTDPDNGTGAAQPDTPAAVYSGSPATVAILDAAESLGYDSDQSYVTTASVTDVEAGGAITLAGLRALVDANPSEPEPAPEG